MKLSFTQQQTNCLKQQVWWVGCNDTPFLVKAAICNETILLAITNMNQLWRARIEKQKLLSDKNIFAKTLEIKGIKQLLCLFEGLLVNPEKKADYHFILTKQKKLIFRLNKEIQVYPFTWKFQLQEAELPLTQIICQQLINPLLTTLNAQEKRTSIIKKKFQYLEKQYIKRLSESQKNMYKPQSYEDIEDWKILVGEQKQQMLLDIRLDEASKFFYMSSLKQPEKKQQIQINNEKIKKIKKIIQYQQQKPQQLLNQIEFKKQMLLEKNKNDKIKDFI